MTVCDTYSTQAHACYDLFCQATDKKQKMTLLWDGQKHALQGLEHDDKDFLCLRWAAITTGHLTDNLPTREKIEQSVKFKEYLDRALAINNKEYALLHMRGRFAYSVAGVSWLERKAASLIYSTVPEATYEEALENFLAANNERAAWIENLVYIGRCYLELKQKDLAKKYLQEALGIASKDKSEEELLQEAKKLLAKC